MIDEDGDPGDEHRTRAEFERENPHVECDCMKTDHPDKWCRIHRQIWEAKDDD